VNGGDGRSPQVSLFATEAFVASHRSLLLNLVAAWRESSREVSASPAVAARAFAGALELAPEVLEEAARRTLFEVPDLEVNESRVIEYYRQVAPFFPADKRALEAQFFFVP
jgi:ABC-type nitrate/sulfonate/bicarbonate transport system substrate-binding protein